MTLIRTSGCIASLTLLVMLSGATPALAADYYADATRGDDANPGTQAAPLKTLSAATRKLSPGDTLYLTGRWTTPLSVPAGSANQRITVAAAPNASPEIEVSGGVHAVTLAAHTTLQGVTIKNSMPGVGTYALVRV